MSAQKDKSASSVKVGMNKDVHISNLQESEYSHAKNSNFFDEQGNGYNIQNEHSNILASKFKEGYKVIGLLNDVNLNTTFFFLTNPTTGFSEIGKISTTKEVPNYFDKVTDCGDCNQAVTDNPSLDQITQTEHQTYETLLEDTCNGCLNFSIDFPIKTSVIKNEKIGLSLYFTDNFNPPRYIQLDKLEQYSFVGEELCGVDDTIPTCLDCHKLKMFKEADFPIIDPFEIVLGGNLRRGVYQFVLAYSDESGNELSRYFTVTEPISVFDLQNNVLTDNQTADRTNYAIKVKLSNLDKTYTHYKLVVIQNADISRATSFFVAGVYSTSNETVLFTTEQNKTGIGLNRLSQFAVRVEKIEKLSTANNYLIGKGFSDKKQPNLQKVVNFIGTYLQWQSHVATENLYKDGAKAAKYKQFTRDETYPLALRFLQDGEYTFTFPLIGRAPTQNDLDIIDNEDSQSINKQGSTCSTEVLDKRWQLYNTAERTGFLQNEDIPTNPVEITKTESCNIGDKDNPLGELTNGKIIITLEQGQEFFSLDFFLRDNIEEILETPDSELDADFLAIKNLFLLSNYTQDNCTPEFDQQCSSTIDLVEERIELIEANETEVVFVPASFPDEYPSARPPQNCNIFAIPTGGNSNPPTAFQGGRFNFFRPGDFGSRSRFAYLTSEFPFETSFNTADTILPTTDLRTNVNSFFVNYFFAKLESELLTNKNAQTIQSQWNSNFTYNDKIAKGAKWFRIEQFEDEFVLSMSRDDSSNTNYFNSREYRVSIYTSGANATAPVYTTLKSIASSLNIKFKKEGDDLKLQNSSSPEITITNASNSFYLIAIDTPIIPLGAIIDPDNTWTEEGKALWVEGQEEVNGEMQDVEVQPDFFTPASTGCFSLAVLNRINSAVEVDYDSIKVLKVQEYSSECTYDIPIINDDCEAIPYAYGSMGYVESTETYPDNAELFNSEDLVITPQDLTEELYIDEENTQISFKQFFEENFTDGVSEGKYILKNADFRCNPIRHFKFPDNKVSSFMWEATLPDFADSLIFPMGVKLDGRIVSNMLDIAVTNGLLTQEQRDSIQGFEILRGNRSAEKSIVAKGITFDLYKYTKNNKEVHYANYPLNSLGADNLHYEDSSRTTFIQHPYESEKNHQWTFSSPETDYNSISIPSLMKVDGFMFGTTMGNFDLVDGHPKWTILGRRLERTAGSLALLEVVAEAVIASMEAFSNYNQVVGFTNTVFSGAWVASPVIAGFNTITSAVFKYARYKYEWLEIFRNLGKRRNFASYYTTVGKMNRLNPNPIAGNELRSLNIRTNIKDGRFIFTDSVEGSRMELNHMDREKSVILSTGSNYPIDYPSEYQNYDNTSRNNASRTFASQALACATGISEDVERRAASMYVTLKNYLPSQYGTINSVEWIPISKRGYLNQDNLFFGGDTFICRHTLRRPLPFFSATAFDQADMTPYEYKFYANIGDEPRFFCNFESDSEEREGGTLLPYRNSEYNFDCQGNTRGSYIKEPSKFYLWYNGIPSFLTETEINTNFRYAQPEPWNNFYPNEADFMRWTQEKENPVRRGNNFFYNREYSLQTTPIGVALAPVNYNKEDFDKTFENPNGILYSLPDNEETARFDPWLIFRPNDRYEFPTKYGKLNLIKGIENEQVLTVFDNTSAVFNAVDQLVDDGTIPGASQTGLGGIFNRRPRVFSQTDLGFAGTQHYNLLSCEYGHFYVDSDRGQVFKVSVAGQGIEEISSNSNGEPSGMKNWFKTNLPFKIKNYFPNIDIDNPFNGFGITMGYDSRFKRVFITKKDGIPKDISSLYEKEGVLYKKDDTRATYQDFEEVSWTVSYSLELGKWASFFDFLPNYYVNHNMFFQTGKNTDDNEFGLWSHLLTNKSFQVFYGNAYKWEIEVPVQTNMVNKVLESFSYVLDSRQYLNEFDFIQNKEIGFENAYIYNNSNHSGSLKLKLQKTVGELSKYPKTEGNTQTILQTQQDGVMRFNYFYNRVKREFSGVPLFKNNKNGVDKSLNNKAVSFFGKSVLERMRGDNFLVNLSTTETKHKKIFKFAITSKNLYTK